MVEPVKLSRDQLTLLRAIASEPNGILLEARHTTAASLVRKGLISRTPAPQEYSVHWRKNVNMIKEALAALDVIESQSVPIWHLHDRARACLALRSALEAAQQEAEAWEVIEKWCVYRGLKQPSSAYTLELQPPQGNEARWFAGLVEYQNGDRVRSYETAPGDSRVDALIKIAAWCRAELAK